METSRLDELIPLLDSTALPRMLTRADALDRGFTRGAIEHRLTTGRWRRILPSVYLTADTLTWTDRMQAASALAGDAALLTGAAALADQMLRSVSRPDRIVVLVPRTTGTRDAGWVQIRRTRRLPERALLPGPPRVPLSRAVADLALERRHLDDVRALVAQAVRAGLCTIDELQSELVSGPRRGSANLRIAIDDVAGGAWSALEARAARILLRADVPPFKQNARIELPGGGHYVVDFLWRELKAILEIDSHTHHFDNPADLDATTDRHLVLETLGYTVVHRRPRMITHEPKRFQADIEAWLAARTRELGRGVSGRSW